MKKEKEMSDYLKADFPFDVLGMWSNLQALRVFIYTGAWRKYALPNKAFACQKRAGQKSKRLPAPATSGRKRKTVTDAFLVKWNKQIRG